MAETVSAVRDNSAIAMALDLLLAPGQVAELRILNTERGTQSGYFDNFDLLARSGAAGSGKGSGVYVTLNPVQPALLGRANNRLKSHARQTTSDRDIVSRRWLPFDFDPIRPAGISSTETEHAAALERAADCRLWLRGLGWPEPLTADSGNGAHLLYRIELPCDDASRQLIQGCLEAAAVHFGDGSVSVDLKTFNASRIWKLYGTRARKGDATMERPHRLSAVVLGFEGPRLVVTLDKLRKLASLQPQDDWPLRPTHTGHQGGFDLQDWLTERGLMVVQSGSWLGGQKYILNPCPFNPDHVNRSAYVVQFPSGAIAAGCHHGSCAGNDWRALREITGDRTAAQPSLLTLRLGKSDTEHQARPTQATVLMELALASGAEFSHDEDTAYLHVPVEDHVETFRLRSRHGRCWLQKLYIDHTRTCPAAQTIADASSALEARCLNGPERPVFLRIARIDNVVYIDLGDSSWRIVEVTEAGWRVISTAPVRFRRTRHSRSLPEPIHGGSVNALREFVNVGDDDFVLFVAVLVAMFRGRGPYPILVVNGEQGTAKSTLCRLVKRLVDPRAGPLRAAPRDERDLMIAATQAHVLVYDNLSSLPQWLSDALSRIATGGGLATRQLYEDSEEHVFEASRPLVLNGIPELAAQPDLVSRAVLLTCPPIEDDQRKTEDAFWAAFDHELPSVLGSLLDIVGVALHREATVHLERTPRMADFAQFVVAGEPACPWSTGTFLRLYTGNRQGAVEVTLEGEPVADFVRSVNSWRGTATDMLMEINARTHEARRSGNWPKKPRQVADVLRRLAPALRELGVLVTFVRSGSEGRLVKVARLEKASAIPSLATPSTDSPRTSDDASGAAPGASAPGSSPSPSHSSVASDGRDDRDAVARLCSVPLASPTARSHD